MSRKLIIRRVGTKIPTVCLVIFLLITTVISWLTLAGLPDSVLREIEKTAADAGLHLKLNGVYLEPYRGFSLRAEGVRLYAKEDDQAPLASFESVSAKLNLFQLITGDFPLRKLSVRNGNISLPVTDSPGETLSARDITLVASINKNGQLHISSGALQLQGVSINVNAKIDNFTQLIAQETSNENEQTDGTGALDIPALLAEYSSYTNEAYHFISKQNWSDDEAPALRLNIIKQGELVITLEGEMPRYDFDIHKLRNIRLAIAYRNDTITINNLRFSTIDPPSNTSLQAGYATQTRELGLRFNSTASLVPMLTQALGENEAGVLAKITHSPEDAPRINLSGSFNLTESYSLENIRLDGELEQKNLYIGDNKIDIVSLEFFYRNGNFNIKRLEFQYNNSTLSLMATANNGEGTASLRADVDVNQTLAIINEFTETPITLPDDLELGDRVKLVLQAALTTPNFEEGEKDWQLFTPNVHNLRLTLSTERMNAGGVMLTRPDIRVLISGIRQTDNKIPTNAEEINLTLSAEEVSADGVRINGFRADAMLKGISYLNNELIINTLSLIPTEEQLMQNVQHGDTRINGVNMSLTLSGIRYQNEQLSIDKTEGSLSAASINHRETLISGLKLDIPEISHLSPQAHHSELFRAANLDFSIENISHADTTLGHLSATLHMTEGERGAADITFGAASAGHGQAVNECHADIDWTDERNILFTGVTLRLFPATYQDILERFDVSVPQVKLPEMLSASGSFALDAETMHVKNAEIDLSIPELVRTPNRVVAFRGCEIPIAIAAKIDLNATEDGEYTYKADLTVNHNNNNLEAEINGTTAGRLHITGRNDIRADVVDRLIDSSDAHEIIRDFKFTSNSSNDITGIDVTVDYSNGLCVDSYCDVSLRNVAYQLAVIEEDSSGRESVRRDLGNNPYTDVRHGLCFVRAKVRYDQVVNGTPIKDECCITIGNITMVYDNSAWLARQNFNALGFSSSELRNLRNTHRHTTLRGDAVIIDVENSFVELVNVKGSVYPGYSLGMFFAPLHEFLEDVIMPTPADIETQSCVFPIYSDCTRAMSGTIRAASPSKCGFRFLGTTIPLTGFSGFIRITDDYLLLDQMNAACWEGVLDATVKIGISGRRTSFDGLVNARNMNLSSILASYNTEFSPALCNGQLRFRSPTPDINDIQGYGNISVVNGDLMGSTIFHPIGELVSDLPAKLLLLESAAESQEAGNRPSYIASAFSGTGNAISAMGRRARVLPGYNHIFSYDIQDAYANFVIADGHLRAYEMKAQGYNLDVDMKLDIDLDTLYIHGNLWPKVTSLPTVILSPVTFLSDFMIDIIVYGTIEELDWKFGLDRRINGDRPSASSEPGNGNYRPRAR